MQAMVCFKTEAMWCFSMVAVDAGHDVCGSGAGAVCSAGGHHSAVLRMQALQLQPCCRRAAAAGM